MAKVLDMEKRHYPIGSGDRSFGLSIKSLSSERRHVACRAEQESGPVCV